MNTENIGSYLKYWFDLYEKYCISLNKKKIDKYFFRSIVILLFK